MFDPATPPRRPRASDPPWQERELSGPSQREDGWLPQLAEAGAAGSKSRIDRAGERLRGWLTGAVDLREPELTRELVVIDNFRTCHADPLTKVAAGIRYYVDRHSSAKVNDRPVVAQRLKRMRTIADKLLREPEMRLSQMHDIGGCRALFGSIDEISATIDHLEKHGVLSAWC